MTDPIPFAVFLVACYVVVHLLRRWARDHDDAYTTHARIVMENSHPKPRRPEPHMIDWHQELLDLDPVYREIDAARRNTPVLDYWQSRVGERGPEPIVVQNCYGDVVATYTENGSWPPSSRKLSP